MTPDDLEQIHRARTERAADAAASAAYRAALQAGHTIAYANDRAAAARADQLARAEAAS